MSIDNNSECVRSKYFAGQTAMDESLSDFQEEKKSCKGPKPAQKRSKPKTKKVTKRIKGQKDIRSALKGKKNELLQYSKEFDTVCKKSGLNVDSEQLQLAIALSKSLQTEAASIPETSQSSSSQARVAKIRKTLQEYGFKVPEAKIASNKRTRKYRKNYKLLRTTEEERQQKISGRYSEILFQNCGCSKLDDNSSTHVNDSNKVIYIATNAFYEYMKDNCIFYVDNLIEKSTTSGSLLRDWSEIPGRPVSPSLLDNSTMDFTDIECSQEELDVLLSGPIKAVRDIFATKRVNYKSKNTNCDVPSIIVDDEAKVEQEDSFVNNKEHVEIETETPFGKVIEIKSPLKEGFRTKTPLKEVPTTQSPNKVASETDTNNEKGQIDTESCKLTVTQPYRSCSPDMFDDNDDEICSIIENSKPSIVLSQEHKTKVFAEDNLMDLTECANVFSQKSEKSVSQNIISQKSDQLSQNVTKRKSNDFMEITECIVGSSQPIREGFKEIDLTQSPEDIVKENHVNSVNEITLNYVEVNDNDSTIENDETVINNPEEDRELERDNIDLTQSSNEGDSKVQEGNSNGKTELQSMDLTQSTNSEDIDELPIVDFGNSQAEKSLDDTILLSAEEYMEPDVKVRKSTIFENVVNDEVFDLTQEVTENEKKFLLSPILKSNVESSSNNFYEDFVHDHSDNTENSRNNSHVSTEDSNNLQNSINKEFNDIDLTQNSNSEDDIVEYMVRNSSLGKKGDVSIDYDEIEGNLSYKESEQENSFKLQYESSKSNIDNDLEIIHNDNDPDINSSQNSEVFHISDKELDYSLHKSRHDISRQHQHDFSKSNIYNHTEVIDVNEEQDINSSQNSEVFNMSDKELDYSLQKSRHDISRQSQHDCSKSNIDNDTEIIYREQEQDINSSRNSEVFHISDKELDYSIHKSRHDISRQSQHDCSRSNNDNDIEIINVNEEQAINSIQNSEAFHISDKELDYSLHKSRYDISRQSQHDCSKSNIDNDIEIVNSNDEQDINSSQNSEKNHEPDKELNYSLHKSSHDIPRDNFDFGGISVLHNVTKISFRKTLSDSAIGNRKTLTDSFLPEVDIKGTDKPSQAQSKNTEVSSPLKIKDILRSNPGVFTVQTPKNSELIIKMDNVTPMLDYAAMSTPQRNRELDKYGLKPFKRKRAIQILTHLYNQMHPTVQELVEEDQPSPSKKPRRETPAPSPAKSITPPRNSPLKNQRTVNRLSRSPKKDIVIVDSENLGSQSSKITVVRENGCEGMAKGVESVEGVCSYEVTNEAAVIKGVDCDPDDWVFQKREKAKVHSCRVPLHIAFHNYVLSRRSLREAILRYEPVNIDVIHKDLVAYGHRYDPKDLLKFLDKKCITVKTADNNTRNNRR